MANTNILQLPLAIGLTGSEYIPLVQGGTTKRVASSLLGSGPQTSAQLANTVYAGPASGSPDGPSFRALVAADIPASIVTLGIGSTVISGGTTTRILYDNGGVLGEYAVSGSGSVAMTASPTFVTPVLGTPASATLTNCTGLPLTTGVTGTLPVANGGTGITSFGTGVATALGQNVTGSGGIALSVSPSFTTPLLGTPTSGTLTNCIGLPLTSGVTGTLPVTNGGTGITAFGTGVATALGQNVTGSGGIALATSPSFTTPTLGVATATSINRVALTTPATNATIAFADTTSTTLSGGVLRRVLTGNLDFYVRTDGSDSNTGLANSAGGAWLTLQYAWNWICANIDCDGYFATVNIGAGTYTAGIAAFKNAVGGPGSSLSGIRFVGDITTPSNVVISTSGICVLATGPETCVIISGVKFTSSGNNCLYASGGGFISIPGKVEFGSASAYHMLANVTGNIVVAASSYIISGAAQIHYYATKCGVVEVDTAAVTITGTPAFGIAFAAAAGGYLVHSGCTFTGAATGSRYTAILNGVVDSGGGGANYFPGNGAGSTATGGQYN